MTKPRTHVHAYVFGSAKAGQTTAAKAGRSRVKPLPSADKLLAKKEEASSVDAAMSALAPDNAHLRAALKDILAICETPGRSADKVRRIEVLALAGLNG